MNAKALRRWIFTLAVSWLGLNGCSDSSSSGGFAGLADTAPESAFEQPAPGDRIALPADWGAHPAHRIEWWYLTANLTTADGRPLGLQWTQFRQGLEPASAHESPPPASSWPMRSVWMAHGAVSFQGEHWFAERFARGDIGQAGARAAPLRVWLDHWQLQAAGSNQWQLSAAGEEWSYQLTLTPGKRIVEHGDQGFSAKSSDGFGSMYFSLLDIGVSGTVRLQGQEYPVTGTAWLDREWSSQFLRSDQQGWDWFALRLVNGGRLMAFRVGRGDDAFLSGTWVDPTGKVRSLAQEALALEPIEYRDTDRGEIPVRWRIKVPGEGLDLMVQAPGGSYWNAGLYPYWESPVSVSGTVGGEGYMELTGYGPP